MNNRKESKPKLKHDILKYDDADDYVSLRDAFRDKLNEIPKDASKEVKRFYQRGVELYASLVAQEKMKHFDSKIYGEIFKTAAALLSTPGDETLHQKLSDLSQETRSNGKMVVDGHPSFRKQQVFFAIAAFVAAAALAIAGVAISLGVPFFSMPVAISCFASSAALFALGGASMYLQVRKHGSAKAIDNFEEAAAKIPRIGFFNTGRNEMPRTTTEDVAGNTRINAI